MKANRLVLALLLALILLPAAEARTYQVRDCNGDKRGIDSDDPGNYTTGEPIDLCARGYYGFTRMVFIGQLWAAPIATVALIVSGFVFFTAGHNATRRLAAGTTMGFLVLGLALILSATYFVDTLYSIFGT